MIAFIVSIAVGLFILLGRTKLVHQTRVVTTVARTGTDISNYALVNPLAMPCRDIAAVVKLNPENSNRVTHSLENTLML